MSLLFDNVDDYAVTTTPPVTATPLTIAAWVNPNSVGTLDGIVHIGDAALGTVTQCFLLRMDASGQVNFYAADTAGNSAITTNTTATMTASAWNHAVGISTSAASRRSVLNGNWAESGTNTTSRTPTGVTDLTLGVFPNGGSPSNEWNGYIAHVAVWDIALSQAEVEALAGGANPLTIQNANLVAYWPMTDSGTVTEDVVGTNDLTLSGNTAYNAAAPTVDALGHPALSRARGIPGRNTIASRFGRGW